MHYEIVEARRDDWTILQKLNSDLYSYEKKFDSTFDPKSSYEYQDEIDYYKGAVLGEDNHKVFFIKVSGGYIGMVVLETLPTEHRKDKFILSVKELYIEEKFRGKGLGKVLIKFVEDYAKKEGFKRLHLSVLLKNLDAKRFYEELGFEDYSIEMEKSL